MSGAWRRLWNQFSFGQHPWTFIELVEHFRDFLSGPTTTSTTTSRRHCRPCCAVYWSHPIKTSEKENISIIASLKWFHPPKKPLWLSLNWQRSLAECPKSFPVQNVLLILQKTQGLPTFHETQVYWRNWSMTFPKSRTQAGATGCCEPSNASCTNTDSRFYVNFHSEKLLFAQKILSVGTKKKLHSPQSIPDHCSVRMLKRRR